MHYKDCSVVDILFTHYEDESETNPMTFNITRILADVKTKLRPIVHIAIDEGAAMRILQTHGVERHRLELIRTVADPDPVLLAIFPDGSHLLIDGAHRYVAMAFNEKKTLRARMVPKSIWSKYLVVGAPVPSRKAILEGVPSGL